jgi:ribonuclease HII
MTTDPVIAGLDEAGRGPLAGPVVAAACILPHPLHLRDERGAWSPFPSARKRDCFIMDSKQLDAAERTAACAWITEHCAHGIGFASAEEVDSLGILGATERAMHLALQQLETHTKPTYLLVDGRDHFWFDYPHSGVIHGDAVEPCIAAASILAKVARDRWMEEQALRFPQFSFAEHKGYATAQHLQELERYGPCALHRRRYLRKFDERLASLSTTTRPTQGAEAGS